MRLPIPEAIREGRVIAIGRGILAADAPRIGEALAKGGIRAVELTLNEPENEALAAIEALAVRADDLGVIVGAGTVLSVAAASRAMDAGARFIVTPTTDEDVIRWCVTCHKPCFPGALSPTEIFSAWRAGASAVKIFPASSVGPAYLKLLAGPFPEILTVPTGGVSADTAGSWIAAGAAALGMGGWIIGDGDASGVTSRARQVVAAIAAA